MDTRPVWGGVRSAVALALSAAVVAACSKGPSKLQVDTTQIAAARAVANSPCPPDGLWKECSLIERLIRSGVGVRRDSTPVHEPGVPIPGVLYHLGNANLEVFYFADSAARKAAVARMDTTQFVQYDQPQSMRAERSIIESANVLALLDSRDDEQRQRVGDAITAGAPQPPTPAK